MRRSSPKDQEVGLVILRVEVGAYPAAPYVSPSAGALLPSRVSDARTWLIAGRCGR